MRSRMASLLMMSVVEAAACGGSSPLQPSPVARDHVESPGVLSVAEAPAPGAASVRCTPAVSPASGSQTAPADQTTRWTMTVAFPDAADGRRQECRWRMESVDRDLVIYDGASGTCSDATAARAGDGRVEIVVPARAQPDGGVAVATVRILRVTVEGVDQPTHWSYVGYRWTRL